MSLSGCTLLQLRSESQEFFSATVLAGRVSAESDWQGPIIVAAIQRQGRQPRIAHKVWLHELGGYELIVPEGTYDVLAFGDSDRDGVLDDDDPIATATEIKASGSGILMMLDLTLTQSAAPERRKLLPAISSPTSPHSTQVGAIADLDAPAFSAEEGRAGYWTPLESFRRVGGNIYFLEPYDPNRTPVLFVHGAAGSAQDWRYFYDQLDRTRYQAWFFQYPSGASLDSIAHLLYWKLRNAQARYPFARVHIVAHSMGGLVVRRFLLDHGMQFPQLGQFVTLSTPWGGEPAATLGVKHSPAVVPSWREMQPDGPFMQRLFAQRLPNEVTHTLLFGHRGGYNMLRPTTDGTVTLASQLRTAAQLEARLVMGFDEDHTSILASPEVFAQVVRVLDSDQQEEAGGDLQVSIATHDARSALATVIPVLLLSRAGEGMRDENPRVILLGGDTKDTVVGPVPIGSYTARLFVPGFRVTPASADIFVGADGSSHLSFSLAAQGTLCTYVGDDGDAFTYPAGSYRPPHPTIEIERIVLRGANGARILEPRAGSEQDLWMSYADGRDDAIGAAFNFQNLEDGDYELEIVAKGYEPHTSTHRVRAGVVPPVSPIVMERSASRD